MANIMTFLTVQQVADACNVRPKTVYGWIAAGKLRRHKLGGAVRVAAIDLDRFVAAGGRTDRPDPVAARPVAVPSRLSGHPASDLFKYVKPRDRA
jgi:excisionase family DNA binding protein